MSKAHCYINFKFFTSMKTVITTTDPSSKEFSYIIEFNLDIPELACTSVAPNSTLEVTELYRQTFTDPLSSSQKDLVKLNLVLTLSYTNLLGQRKSFSTRQTTIYTAPTGQYTNYSITKVVDVLVPSGTSKVTNQTISNTPSSTPQRSRCAYSVFILEPVVPTSAETTNN